MRTFRPGEDLYHRLTGIPVRFVRAVGDVVTVEMFDPAGTGKHIQKAYPADELATYDERNARLEEEADKSRRKALRADHFATRVNSTFAAS